ncbi:MAG: gamma-glutamyltransferase [Candidatus Delongbacteria bacterium]|nr:gamma-glutamyltransferase [Candidatus Delongbacteria bacterium]
MRGRAFQRGLPLLLAGLLACGGQLENPAWRNGAVVSADSLASMAGLKILRAGGSAADAAIATTLALAVCEPYSSGLGGGCLLVSHSAEDGVTRAISGRENAPAAARFDMYLDADGLPMPDLSGAGILAVAVPCELQALALLHEEQGHLPWHDLVEPARLLAEQGFSVGPRLGRVLAASDSLLRLHNDVASQPWWKDGEILDTGDRLIQPALARSLARLQELGVREFLELVFAPALDSLAQERGGILTGGDLLAVEATAETVVSGSYHGLELRSIGAPSSGGALLIEALQVLDGQQLDTLAPRDPLRIDRVARTLEYAFADRARWFGDPRFCTIPLDRLLSEEYADSLRALVTSGIRTDQAWPGLEREIREGDHTTHVCVIDSRGNAVSLTATINTYFGSGITEPRTGIVLNNEMDDFVIQPGVPNFYGLVGSPRNAVRAGARPLSSMTPLIVLKNGQVHLVAGSQGGPKIISTVLLHALDLVDYGMDPADALALPRYHQQWRPALLMLEPAFSPASRTRLRELGWELDERTEPWSVASLLLRDPDGRLRGAADPRADGLALGY